MIFGIRGKLRIHEYALKKNTICTTIINIKPPKDSYMLRRSAQKDQSTHSHTVWLQLVFRERNRLGLACCGRSLGTSFNSTLLWKLQLPLSRLVPTLHPCAAVASTTQTTPAGLQSLRIPTPQTSDVCWRMCVRVYVCVCLCVSNLPNHLHAQKGTLKTFGKDKNLWKTRLQHITNSS